MKKVIFLFLLLFLVFGIKEAVLADFDEDGKPTGGSATHITTSGAQLEWNHYGSGSDTAKSYTVTVRGPGWRSGEVCVNINQAWACSSGVANPAYDIPSGTLDSSETNGCEYHWKVRAWENCNCSGKHSKWSDRWSFNTNPSGISGDICESTPGAPGVVKSIESCKLKYDFTDVDTNCVQGETVGPETNSDVDNNTIKWGICCFLNTLYKISDIMILLIAPFAILVFLYAGFQFMTSSGDVNKLKSVQGLMLYAGIGLFIAVLAKAIVFAIKSIV